MIAASYWSGPSRRRSGRSARASSVARFTLRTSSPAPLVPVEYDSIATRGRIPNAGAESALWMAMSASCSAVGFGFTAQSPKTSVPCRRGHEDELRVERLRHERVDAGGPHHARLGRQPLHHQHVGAVAGRLAERHHLLEQRLIIAGGEESLRLVAVDRRRRREGGSG